MDKERILLFGASEHTGYTVDIIEQEGKYEIAGILDVTLVKGMTYAGYEILGKDEELRPIVEAYRVSKGIVAIGDNFLRKKVVEKIRNLASGFSFINAIHPSVIIGKNVKIGGGSVLMAAVVINNDCIIGEHCFLATKASVDHNSSLGDFSSASAGATIGGHVNIGSCTAIALGVNIIHGRTIGDHTVIGAGALVVKDIGDNVIAYGIPAREIRKRNNGERYL